MQKGGVNYSPASELLLTVSLNGLVQVPSNSFTISGSTIFAETWSPEMSLITSPTVNQLPEQWNRWMRGHSDKICPQSAERYTSMVLSVHNTSTASSERAMVAGTFTIDSEVTLTVNGRWRSNHWSMNLPLRHQATKSSCLKVGLFRFSTRNLLGS